MKVIVGIVVCTSFAFVFTGCASDASCDDGFILVGGTCRPDDDGAVDSGTVDGGDAGDTGGGDTGGGDTGMCTGDFGFACTDDTTHAECDCPGSPFCAIQPMQTEGVCTATGCAADEDPSVCPMDWTCLDLRMFMTPSICVPPTP